jgi:hypothetical protein
MAFAEIRMLSAPCRVTTASPVIGDEQPGNNVAILTTEFAFFNRGVSPLE